jgi:hypothetical protein
LVSRSNPLAARVWANRVWAELFGIGIVETAEDFGPSGLPPVHRELLDHLAIRLRDVHGWRLKPFLREIVLSATYRQSANAAAEVVARDPQNRWLARGPRTRLAAEMIRDQALLVSGLLTPALGGPPAMPPQPEGVWQAVYSGAEWKTAEGANRFRRGLYTYWRRTSPYPSFLTSDSPTRDVCSARRIATNTPLQALVTLNDPVYFECAQALARRALDAVDQVPAEAIAWMMQAVTQRPIQQQEFHELVALYEDQLRQMEAGGTDASSGSDAAQRSVESAQAEALSMVASAILNLDKALTK